MGDSQLIEVIVTGQMEIMSLRQVKATIGIANATCNFYPVVSRKQ